MKHWLLFVIIVLFFAGCTSDKVDTRMQDGVIYVSNPEKGKWEKQRKCGCDFNLLHVFGKENEPVEEIMGAPSLIVTDNDMHVYVYDRQINRLLKFTENGQLLWTKGHEGQGPGEFLSVRGMLYDGNESLYVCNQGGTRIDKYFLNGDFIKSIDLHSMQLSGLELIGYIKPDVFILTCSKTGESGIHILKINFSDGCTILKEKTVLEDIGIDLPDGLGISQKVSFNSGKLYVSGIRNYTISVYNDNFELEKMISRKFDKLVRPGIFSSSSRRAIHDFGSLGDVYVNADTCLFCSVQWPVNVSDPDGYLLKLLNGTAPDVKYKSSIDLFNAQCEYLGSKIHDSIYPIIGIILHVDTDGNVYTSVREPFPHVRKYRVIMKNGT